MTEQLYSQTTIAKELGISQSTVTRVLRKYDIKPVENKGKSKLYSKKQIDEILSFLNEKKERKKE